MANFGQQVGWYNASFSRVGIYIPIESHKQGFPLSILCCSLAGTNDAATAAAVTSRSPEYHCATTPRSWGPVASHGSTSRSPGRVSCTSTGTDLSSTNATTTVYTSHSSLKETVVFFSVSAHLRTPHSFNYDILPLQKIGDPIARLYRILLPPAPFELFLPPP